MMRLLLQSALALSVLLGLASLAQAQDSDGDTVPDATDNCILVPNLSQYNSDADAFGNACDPDYDNDNTVGIADYLLFYPEFGLVVPPGNPDMDHNEPPNGVIGLLDLEAYKSYWAGPPGP